MKKRVASHRGKKKAHKNAEGYAAHAKGDKPVSRKATIMSIFLSVLLLTIVGILASIAIANWQKGGYRNAWNAYGWGMAAFLIFGAGASLLYYYYIIKPASRVGQDVPQPNIVFGDSRLREPLQAGKKPWVDIVLNNTSDVAAEGRFTDVTWRLVVAPFDNQLEYAYRGLGIDFDLAAHQLREIHFDITYKFTKDDIDALDKQKGFLYVYAKGEYWNGKTPNIRHPLSFCLLYDKDTPGFLVVCPKSVKISEGRPGNITYPNPTPTRKAEVRRTTSQTVAVESSVTPSIDIKVTRAAEKPKQTEQKEADAPKLPQGSADGGAGRDRPLFGSHDFIKWTDYTEDYFYDLIWRWEYKPQMGDKKPRNLAGFCPECERPLQKMGGTGLVEKDGRTVTYYCPHHLQYTQDFQSPTYDDFDGIRQLITDKLNNGQWKEVVKRQMDARSDRM